MATDGPTDRLDFWNVPNNDQQQVKRYDGFCLKAVAHVLGVPPDRVTLTPSIIDRNEAADILVEFGGGTRRIACRIRRYHFLQKYPRDFTIREVRPTGSQTELEKILSGLGDYLLYGFANKAETTVIKFFVADLDVFRRYHRECVTLKQPFGFTRTNKDGTAFRVFNLGDFPVGFLIEHMQANKAGTGWDRISRTWKDDQENWFPLDDTMLLPGEK